MSVHSGGNRKNPRSPTFSRVVPESSAWSQDPSPPVPGSPCLAQEVWDRLADGQKVLSLSSQQALGLRGSMRGRGSHAASTWSTETPAPRHSGQCLRSARASPGIRVPSPGASLGGRAGRRKGGRGQRPSCSQAASNSVLASRFRLPQELPEAEKNSCQPNPSQPDRRPHLPLSSHSPTRRPTKKLQGPHPARQMGRAPRAAPSQVLME